MALYKCLTCSISFKEEPKIQPKVCGNCGSTSNERVSMVGKSYKKKDSRFESRGVLRLRYP